MHHEIHRVTAFEQIGDLVLRIELEDGTQRAIDFEPVLRSGIYAPLRDPEVFREVALDEEAGTLVWPNGADFEPEALHAWPRVVDELTARAESWKRAAARR